MTLVPGKCPACLGSDPQCEKCGGTGATAFTIPDKGRMFGRECSCGDGNGVYFPQPGMWVPTNGAPCLDSDDIPSGPDSNWCPGCGKKGGLVWREVQ